MPEIEEIKVLAPPPVASLADPIDRVGSISPSSKLSVQKKGIWIQLYDANRDQHYYKHTVSGKKRPCTNPPRHFVVGDDANNVGALGLLSAQMKGLVASPPRDLKKASVTLSVLADDDDDDDDDGSYEEEEQKVLAAFECNEERISREPSIGNMTDAVDDNFLEGELLLRVRGVASRLSSVATVVEVEQLTKMPVALHPFMPTAEEADIEPGDLTISNDVIINKDILRVPKGLTVLADGRGLRVADGEKKEHRSVLRDGLTAFVNRDVSSGRHCYQFKILSIGRGITVNNSNNNADDVMPTTLSRPSSARGLHGLSSSTHGASGGGGGGTGGGCFGSIGGNSSSTMGVAIAIGSAPQQHNGGIRSNTSNSHHNSGNALPRGKGGLCQWEGSWCLTNNGEIWKNGVRLVPAPVSIDKEKGVLNKVNHNEIIFPVGSSGSSIAVSDSQSRCWRGFGEGDVVQVDMDCGRGILTVGRNGEMLASLRIGGGMFGAISPAVCLYAEGAEVLFGWCIEAPFNIFFAGSCSGIEEQDSNAAEAVIKEAVRLASPRSIKVRRVHRHSTALAVLLDRQSKEWAAITAMERAEWKRRIQQAPSIVKTAIIAGEKAGSRSVETALARTAWVRGTKRAQKQITKANAAALVALEAAENEEAYRFTLREAAGREALQHASASAADVWSASTAGVPIEILRHYMSMKLESASQHVRPSSSSSALSSSSAAAAVTAAVTPPSSSFSLSPPPALPSICCLSAFKISWKGVDATSAFSALCSTVEGVVVESPHPVPKDFQMNVSACLPSSSFAITLDNQSHLGINADGISGGGGGGGGGGGTSRFMAVVFDARSNMRAGAGNVRFLKSKDSTTDSWGDPNGYSPQAVHVSCKRQCPHHHHHHHHQQLQQWQSATTITTTTSNTTPAEDRAGAADGDEEIDEGNSGGDGGSHLLPGVLDYPLFISNDKMVVSACCSSWEGKVLDGSDWGFRLIAFACADEAEAMVYVTKAKEIAAREAAVDCTNALGESCLLIASAEGNLEAVLYLLSVGANPNFCRTCSGLTTPLHQAVAGRHHDVVRALLRDGAKVVAANMRGEIPLHVACRKGDMISAKLLLERDIEATSVFCKDVLGKQPLDHCKPGKGSNLQDVIKNIMSQVQRDSLQRNGGIELALKLKPVIPFAVTGTKRK